MPDEITEYGYHGTNAESVERCKRVGNRLGME